MISVNQTTSSCKQSQGKIGQHEKTSLDPGGLFPLLGLNIVFRSSMKTSFVSQFDVVKEIMTWYMDSDLLKM